MLKNINKILIKPVFLISLISMIIGIFVINIYTDKVILFMSIFWIISIMVYRLEARFSFYIAFISFTLSSIFILAHTELISEKLAVLSYIMLTVGTIQSIFEASPYLIKIKDTKALNATLNFFRSFILVFDGFLIGFLSFIITLLNFLRSVIQIFDRLIIDLFNFIKYLLISFVIILFKKLPLTIFDLIIFTGKFILLIISLLILVIFSLFTIGQINRTIQIANHNRYRQSLNPIIETIEPKLEYKATKVVIYGKNFGWDITKSQALINGKIIDVTMWTDSKIIFTVPLDWKIGNHKIWIEKTIDWDGKNETAASNVITIRVLPISDNFTEDDKLYFDEMKTWRPETRKINGYE